MEPKNNFKYVKIYANLIFKNFMFYFILLIKIMSAK